MRASSRSTRSSAPRNRSRRAKVKSSAAAHCAALSGCRRAQGAREAGGGDRPAVFVNIDATIDQSKKAPSDAPARLDEDREEQRREDRLRDDVARRPADAERADVAAARARSSSRRPSRRSRSRGPARRRTIACTVAVRIAPWGGTRRRREVGSEQGGVGAGLGEGEDRHERARHRRAASRDCLEAVAEDVTQRQVVPFLKATRSGRQLARAPASSAGS